MKIGKERVCGARRHRPRSKFQMARPCAGGAGVAADAVRGRRSVEAARTERREERPQPQRTVVVAVVVAKAGAHRKTTIASTGMSGRRAMGVPMGRRNAPAASDF